MTAATFLIGGDLSEYNYRDSGSSFLSMATMGRQNSFGTETEVQYEIPVSATGSVLSCTVFANNSTATVDINFRIGSTNGNQQVAITTLATGQFSDSSHTDSISSTNLINGQLTGGNFLNDVSVGTYQMLLLGTSSISVHGFNLLNSSASGSINYLPLGGGSTTSAGQFNTTESRVETTIEAAGTESNLQTYISANSATTTTSLITRHNVVNGNLLASITASTTGLYQDTSHSDSVAASDTLYYSFSAPEASTTWNSIMSLFTGTNTYDMFSEAGNGLTINNPSGSYFATILGGSNTTSNSSDQTESRYYLGYPKAETLQFLRAYIIAGITNAVMTSRVAGSGGNQTISVASAGTVTDTSHNDSVSSGAVTNLKFSGWSSGAVEIQWWGITGGAAPAAFTLSVSTAAYAVTASAVTLIAGGQLVIGTYNAAVTSSTVNMTQTNSLAVATGIYAVAASDLELIWKPFLQIDTAAFSIAVDGMFFGQSAKMTSTFSTLNNGSFVDWQTASEINSGTGEDFHSYLHTWQMVPTTSRMMFPLPDGKSTHYDRPWPAAGMRFGTPYVYTFLEESPEASINSDGVQLQAYWDWAQPASVRITPEQECYNFYNGYLITMSRRKLRGRGRSVQIHYDSETGKNFQISGFAVYFSANASQ